MRRGTGSAQPLPVRTAPGSLIAGAERMRASSSIAAAWVRGCKQTALFVLVIALASPLRGRGALARVPELHTLNWQRNCEATLPDHGLVRANLPLHARLRGAGEGADNNEDDGMGVGERMGDLAMMADRQGFDIGASLGGGTSPAASFTIGNLTEAVDDPATKDARQKQHKLCQDFLDNLYENTLRPMIDELESRVYEGDAAAAEKGELSPYKDFPNHAARVIEANANAVAAALPALGVDLEIAHFAAARGGRPVSTVEFRALPRDELRIAQLLTHVELEARASAQRALGRLWRQHKTLIRDCHVDAFVIEFESAISGSRAFNRTTHALCRRIYRACDKALRESIPKGTGGPRHGGSEEWSYSADLQDLKDTINSKIASRRRQAGVEILSGEWTDGPGAPAPILSARWFKGMAIKGLVTYYQLCQSAWAYRKAKGIKYPERFTQDWFRAVLIPWLGTEGDVKGGQEPQKVPLKPAPRQASKPEGEVSELGSRFRMLETEMFQQAAMPTDARSGRGERKTEQQEERNKLKGRSSGQPAEVQKDGPLSASWWFKPVVGDT